MTKNKQATPVRKVTKVHQKSQRTASHAGFHYHSLYQCCPMKWFIKFILRIESKSTAVPLINGAAFHEGKATFYLTGSEKKALNKVKSEIKDRQEEFADRQEFLSVLERCPILLQHWIDRLGKGDLKRFNFLGVEDEIILPIPGTPYIFTMRLDAVVQEKKGDKSIYIMETKTSSFSIRTTEMGVYYGDQATAYTWGAKNFYKKPIYGVIPDIAYWNKKATGTHNISCVRGDIIMRSDRRIHQFLSSTAQLQTEIAQKVEAYKKGYDPYMLFPRNTYYCNAFFKPCEYAGICDNNLTKIKRLPSDLKRNRSWTKPIPNDYVEDSCSGLT